MQNKVSALGFGITALVFAVVFVASPPVAVTLALAGGVALRQYRRDQRQYIAELHRERVQTWGW